VGGEGLAAEQEMVSSLVERRDDRATGSTARKAGHISAVQRR
jgi:hypothetical protein